MTAFRTSQNPQAYVPYEGMDLATPLPLLPSTKAPWIENWTIDGQSLSNRLGTTAVNINPSYTSGSYGRLAVYNNNGTKTAFGLFNRSSSGTLADTYVQNLGSGGIPTDVDGPYAIGYPWDIASLFQFRTRLYVYAGRTGYNARVWDGATWANAAFTGPADPNTLRSGFAYRNRLYMIEDGTMRLWYGGVDAVQGAMSSFDLSSLSKYGGTLVYGFTMSDTTTTGAVQYLVAVSSEGEVFVYTGGYPASPDWSISSKFTIGRPFGGKNYVEFQNDILISTTTGVVSLKAVIAANTNEATYQTVSKPIDPYWRAISRLLNTFELMNVCTSFYFERTGCIYFNFYKSLARTNNQFDYNTRQDSQIMFIYNTLNGSWVAYTHSPYNPYIRDMVSFGDRLLVAGSTNGKVFEYEKPGEYRDTNSNVGATVPIVSTILSSAIVRYSDTGAISKTDGITAFVSINSLMSVALYLVNNFGKVSGTTTTPSGGSGYVPWFFNVGSIYGYVQYNLTVTVQNSAPALPTTIYAINVLQEGGGLG